VPLGIISKTGQSKSTTAAGWWRQASGEGVKVNGRIRALLRQALLAFHPDRLDREEHLW